MEILIPELISLLLESLFIRHFRLQNYFKCDDVRRQWYKVSGIQDILTLGALQGTNYRAGVRYEPL
jgi:hypothetical protein